MRINRRLKALNVLLFHDFDFPSSLSPLAHKMATQGTSNSDLPGAINAINLQTLTLSDSQLAAQCSTQLLPNFPLPRELRDQIYLYLLHHEYVHDRPYHRRSKDKRGLVSSFNSLAKWNSAHRIN